MKLKNSIKKNRIAINTLQVIRSIYLPFYVFYSKKLPFSILNSQDTVDYILKNKISIGRIGDGELNIMFKNKSIGFQEYTPELAKDLKSIENTSKFRLALPHSLKNTKDDKILIKTFWWSYVKKNFDYLNNSFLAKNKDYLDASFTRVVTEKRDKRKISLILQRVESIWQNRHVIIIEGADTRFGVGNSILDNATNVKRIIVPAKNAYSKKKEIEKTAKKLISSISDPIVIVCLGPTATVVAYDLSKYAQIIDMGHFDLQYEYLKKGYYHPVRVENRYDNEIKNGDVVVDEHDKKYLSEIEVDLR